MNYYIYNIKILIIDLKIKLTYLKNLFINYENLNNSFYNCSFINENMLKIKKKKLKLRTLDKKSINIYKIKAEIVILIEKIINYFLNSSKKFIKSNNINNQKNILNLKYTCKSSNFIKNYKFDHNITKNYSNFTLNKNKRLKI